MLAFIKQHRQEISLDKVDALWFLDTVPLWGHEIDDASLAGEGRSDETSEA